MRLLADESPRLDCRDHLPRSFRLARMAASKSRWHLNRNGVDEVMGSHAKVCLVDGAAAYIGSANFTENGLSKHFELGTLVRGQPAGDLWSIVNRLFADGFFVPQGWLSISQIGD
jgi:phosphatidylserine/phosphatidylglycerophosphate/cardiolipin synthase-like enzyme